MNSLTKISDLFFVAGVVLCSAGAFGLISSGGGFTGLGYLWYWITDGVLRRNVSKPRKDYFTFQKEFLEEQKRSGGLRRRIRVAVLAAGCVCILLSLILALVPGSV